jgi:hypothetical protein
VQKLRGASLSYLRREVISQTNFAHEFAMTNRLNVIGDCGHFQSISSPLEQLSNQNSQSRRALLPASPPEYLRNLSNSTDEPRMTDASSRRQRLHEILNQALNIAEEVQSTIASNQQK